jgi:hypothetical protein
MLGRFCRVLREARPSRNARIEMGVWLFALIGLMPSLSSAQRAAAMTSFRHAGTIKQIQSLDWIGLYDQLEPYARWWKETAACAGIPLPRLRIDSVQFYHINAADFAPTPTDKPDRMVVGVTYAASEQIFIAIRHLRTETTVKHEMMHQILYWWGEPAWDDDGRGEFSRCGLQVSTRVTGEKTKAP